MLVACGDEHVRKANLAVRALKRFTRAPILVVAARSSRPVEHDEVIQFEPPLDHQSNLWQHARTAMKTPVPRGAGSQLQVALCERFHVEVDPRWNLWNGGVFLFDDASRGFLGMWHQFTCRLFNDPELHPRDQGALAATVWTLGLEHEPLLPVDYNWIMGCTLGYHYKLRYEDGCFCYQDHRPKFLHFICDRVDRWEYRKLLKMLDGGEAVLREVSPCVP